MLRDIQNTLLFLLQDKKTALLVALSLDTNVFVVSPLRKTRFVLLLNRFVYFKR